MYTFRETWGVGSVSLHAVVWFHINNDNSNNNNKKNYSLSISKAHDTWVIMDHGSNSGKGVETPIRQILI